MWIALYMYQIYRSIHFYSAISIIHFIVQTNKQARKVLDSIHPRSVYITVRLCVRVHDMNKEIVCVFFLYLHLCADNKSNAAKHTAKHRKKKRTLILFKNYTEYTHLFLETIQNWETVSVCNEKELTIIKYQLFAVMKREIFFLDIQVHNHTTTRVINVRENEWANRNWRFSTDFYNVLRRTAPQLKFKIENRVCSVHTAQHIQSV